MGLTRSRNGLKMRYDVLKENLAKLQQEPSISREISLAKLKQSLENFQKSLAKIRKQQQLLADFPEHFPEESRTEFYFRLLEQSDRLREKALQKGIGLPEGNRFGFIDLIQQGQVPELRLSQWQRESASISLLLNHLFASATKNTAFLGIGRESTQTRELSGAPRDYFDGRQLSLFRQELGRETHAFQLSFRSDTETLRRFLNAFQEYWLPISIRDIEIKTPISPAHSSARNDWILVDSQPSECRIILEWIDSQNPQPQRIKE